jgi:hypothetical protein
MNHGAQRAWKGSNPITINSFMQRSHNHAFVNVALRKGEYILLVLLSICITQDQDSLPQIIYSVGTIVYLHHPRPGFSTANYIFSWYSCLSASPKTRILYCKLRYLSASCLYLESSVFCFIMLDRMPNLTAVWTATSYTSVTGHMAGHGYME